MKNTVRDLTWLKSFLQENGIPVPDTSFYYDNQAIIYIASNSIFHEKAKHMEVDFHFVCSKGSRRKLLLHMHTRRTNLLTYLPMLF